MKPYGVDRSNIQSTLPPSQNSRLPIKKRKFSSSSLTNNGNALTASVAKKLKISSINEFQPQSMAGKKQSLSRDNVVEIVDLTEDDRKPAAIDLTIDDDRKPAAINLVLSPTQRRRGKNLANMQHFHVANVLADMADISSIPQNQQENSVGGGVARVTVAPDQNIVVHEINNSVDLAQLADGQNTAHVIHLKLKGLPIFFNTSEPNRTFF